MIWVFYGFSGNKQRPLPAFPNGTDHDKSFQLVAETLVPTLAVLNPNTIVLVRQAWTKDVVLDALERSPEPIVQVHIITHGDGTRLSLAYLYDGMSRIRQLAREFNRSAKAEADVITAMRRQDAFTANFFFRGLEPARLTAIKGRHRSADEGGAFWQIWGCYSGSDVETIAGVGDPEIDSLLTAFGFGTTTVTGIAVEIARQFGVTCTAARDGGGTEFWHGTPRRTVERNTTTTQAKRPFWLWNAPGSRWVSYDPTGAETPKPVVLGKPREPAELPTGKPPPWLTSLYWKGA